MLANEFQDFVRENNLFNRGHRLLLAFSGGIDSVVLAELLRANDLPFAIAHCNFQLRGKESERDEDFARSYAAPLGNFIKRFDTVSHSANTKTGTQEAARNLRYYWFQQLAKEENFDYIITAHHADDNVETVLMNFFKGTGISGLTGIDAKRNNVVRPLLFASRKQIEAFAVDKGLQWVEDSSNAADHYARNYIRHEIIPALQKRYPAIKENLRNNIERFRSVEAVYKTGLEKITRKLIVKDGELIKLPINRLQNLPGLQTVLFELLHPYGFLPAQLPDVLNLLSSDTGKFILSPTHRLLKNRDWLLINPLSSNDQVIYTIDANTTRLSFPQGELRFKNLPGHTEVVNDPMMAMLNKSKIEFPLLLRRWKEGDYFFPLGMAKKKKLSRFFIDSKLSLFEKEQVWVLESNKRIAWVLGYRIDDRFRLKPSHEVYTVKFRRSPGGQGG